MVSYPDCLKVKLPPAGSEKIVVMYDFLFGALHASWAGRVGHYAYDENADSVARNQDGFIYCFKKEADHNFYTITADSAIAQSFGKEWPEINYEDEYGVAR
jgi:hypothetical protein